VRITLTCRNVKNVERVCLEIINKAKGKEDVEVVGPIRLPTKRLNITTRRSPIG
jgi:small subunit ribosomal protein S20e